MSNKYTYPNGKSATVPSEFTFQASTISNTMDLEWAIAAQQPSNQFTYLGPPSSGNAGAIGLQSPTLPLAIDTRMQNLFGTNGSFFALGQCAFTDLPSKIAFGPERFKATVALAIPGENQYAITPVSGITTDNSTQVKLYYNGLLMPVQTPIVIRNGTETTPAGTQGFTYAFTAKIAARANDGSNGAFFIRQGIIHREQGGDATLVGTIQTIGVDINPGSWIATPPAITADTVFESLQIVVVGATAKTVLWKAVVETIELGN